MSTGLEHEPGLSEALADGGELWLQRVPESEEASLGRPGEIDVAVAGAPQYDPTVLLTEERLRTMLSRLSVEYDIVLLDSPPLLAVSDGLPLLSLADGVILVVRAGTATRPAAERMLRRHRAREPNPARPSARHRRQRRRPMSSLPTTATHTMASANPPERSTSPRASDLAAS